MYFFAFLKRGKNRGRKKKKRKEGERKDVQERNHYHAQDVIYSVFQEEKVAEKKNPEEMSPPIACPQLCDPISSEEKNKGGKGEEIRKKREEKGKQKWIKQKRSAAPIMVMYIISISMGSKEKRKEKNSNGGEKGGGGAWEKTGLWSVRLLSVSKAIKALLRAGRKKKRGEKLWEKKKGKGKKKKNRGVSGNPPANSPLNLYMIADEPVPMEEKKRKGGGGEKFRKEKKKKKKKKSRKPNGNAR